MDERELLLMLRNVQDAILRSCPGTGITLLMDQIRADAQALSDEILQNKSCDGPIVEVVKSPDGVVIIDRSAGLTLTFNRATARSVSAQIMELLDKCEY